MKGIYVREPYATMLTTGRKVIETRSRNMLGKLVGDRVAIIKTGKPSMVIGYANIYCAWYCRKEDFDNHRSLTCIPPADEYDCIGKGKWMYGITNPVACEPHPLPKNRINHGRSWCEYEMEEHI